MWKPSRPRLSPPLGKPGDPQGRLEAKNGKLRLRAGGKLRKAAQIFGNPNLPGMDQYYEPWNYDYQNLTTSPEQKQQPIAGPIPASRVVP